MSHAIDPDQYRREQNDEGDRHPWSCENWPACRNSAESLHGGLCLECKERQRQEFDLQVDRYMRRFETKASA